MQILLVSLFGAIGVTGRFLVDRHFATSMVSDFPYATFGINCIGSFAIGLVSVLGAEQGVISKEVAIILAVGLLGGFTTFSAFSMQTFQLVERGHYGIAATYFVGSPVIGLISAIGGVYLARTVLGYQ